MTHARTLARAAMLGCVMLLLAAPPSGAQNPAGKVRFAKPAQADLENVGIAQHQGFVESRYWRVRAYPPSWDSYLSWFPGAWGYKDAYAVYNPDAYPPGHVDPPNMNWVLRDSRGRPVYIPFDCGGEYCTQYAGDMGNAAFRRWWIDGAKEYVRSGYKGVFVDDMTIYPRVSDGAGNGVKPIDPRTGQAMTDAAWAKYAVEFMEQLRAELKAMRPDVELVFNVLWYHPDLDGPQEPYVKRLIAAADFLEIERGYTDTHPVENTKYSWETCLRWVDYAHSQGKGIVADSYTDTRAGAEYELATSLLVNEGKDSLSTGYRALPTNWWRGYEVDLGAAEGRRYPWRGGWRRDFEGGSVVVAPPGATVSGTLEQPLKDLDGDTHSSVSLSDKRGIVLVRDRAGQSASPPPVVVVNPRPNPKPVETRTAPRRPAGGGPASGQRAGAKTRRLRRTVLVRGKVRRAAGGRVRLFVGRRHKDHWRRVRTRTVKVLAGRSFRRVFRNLKRGRYRVIARYVGRGRARSTRRFRLRY